jgi:hypothetical protein
MTNGSPSPDEFVIKSNPIFLLRRGDQTEVVVMNATMRIRTQQPTRNRQGRSQTDIEVTEWEASGPSQLLGRDLEFKLSNVRQRASTVVARREGDAFPATLRFKMEYEVASGRERVSGLKGTAVGTITAFPPAPTDIFKIEGKDVQLGDLEARALLCAC